MINLPLPIRYHKDSQSNKADWEQLQNRITGWPAFIDMQHHIEAKALAVISIARRMICSAWKLGSDIGWKKVFVESSTILFPMLELIGFARLGQGNSDLCIGSGAEWLLDPYQSPTGNDPKINHRVITSLQKHMKDHITGPEIRDFVHLRNYFLHGLKNVNDPTVSIADFVNYELPYAITMESISNLKIYWEQIKTDDGTKGWIDRLAIANIQPFVIQGSDIFEQGLVDPDILDWLEFPGTSCEDLYTDRPKWAL